MTSHVLKPVVLLLTWMLLGGNPYARAAALATISLERRVPRQAHNLFCPSDCGYPAVSISLKQFFSFNQLFEILYCSSRSFLVP